MRNIGMLIQIHDFGLTLNTNVEIKSAVEKGMMVSKKLSGSVIISLPVNIYNSDRK